jgi:ferric-dicitrate binding protein FerR (iron transport regulator)
MARGPVDHSADRCLAAWFLLIILTPVGLAIPFDARAQGSGCTLQAAGVPPRQILRCQDGLTIEAEAGADYTLLDRGRDGGADAASLRRGALFVDAPARSGGRSFQILTPQAVAAVRGTEWVADVADNRSSVFVVSGRVFVRRATSARGVVLGSGQGVDVEPGTAPLVVRRWPAARAAALLARFGR